MMRDFEVVTAGRCDLHMHTYYSDGLSSPEALVRQAARLGLHTIAITDHDNTRGNREAQPLARELGLDLITAVEFATRWDGYGWHDWGGVVDLLGYLVDWDEPSFRALEDEALSAYFSQLEQTCERARQAGYPITFEEAAAENPFYPSVYSMVSALRKKGLPEDEDTLLDRMVDCWNAICDLQIPIQRAIDVIHAAGGVAVLAHPSVVFRPAGGWITADDLKPLVDRGLDGIEVYHYRLPDEATRQHFLEMAEALNLIPTGGSDEHNRPDGFRRLGQQPVGSDIVEALRARSEQHR